MKFYLYCLFISLLLSTHYPPMYAGNPDSWPRLHTSALNKSHRDSYFQILKFDPGTGTGTGGGTGGGGEFLLSSCFLVLVPSSPHNHNSAVLYCTVLYCTVLYCVSWSPSSLLTSQLQQNSGSSLLLPHCTLTYHRATQLFQLEITITQMKLFL